MTLILFTGVLLSIAHSAVGINCFNCSSVEDSKCGSDTVHQLRPIQCEPKFTRCFSYRQEGPFYSYQNDKYESGLRILRGCSTVTEMGADTCVARAAQSQSMRVRYCSCDKNECNSVLQNLKASLPLIFVLHLLLYIFDRH